MANQTKIEREMAAIMFTDIVGYTRLTAENEEKAFQLIKRKRELLLPALQRANGVIEKRQSIPILSNVLLNVNNSNLTITATDLDLIFIHQIRF